jgi:hypothetical protein
MMGWFEHYRQAWVLIGLAVISLACTAWLLRRYRRYRRSHIALRALGAERAALVLLRRMGYAVLDTQVRTPWIVRHGQNELEVTLRADAIVQRSGRRFIAEVKSSSFVADLRHGPTRRQLLEYAVAYGTDGVLLVDMHAQHVEEIEFPGLFRPNPRQKWFRVPACALAFVLGIGLALLLLLVVSALASRGFAGWALV